MPGFFTYASNIFPCGNIVNTLLMRFAMRQGYWRAVRKFFGGPPLKLLRQGLMSSPPRRV
jgi:hypothetical protein